MSAISMFYGIIIRVVGEEDYQRPCFHATYQKYHAVITTDGDVVNGTMPRRQLKLILAWAEIHKDDLIAAWELAVRKEPLFGIDPLK